MTDKLREMWKVSVEELKSEADKNHTEDNIRVMKMGLFMPTFCGFSEEKENNFSEVDENLYALAYHDEEHGLLSYGGNLIARPDILTQIAGGIGKDLLILPSSRDDIIVTAMELTRDFFDSQCESVRRVNEDVLIADGDSQMILSDHPYIFSLENGRVLEEDEVSTYLK